jgi:hypothetical protein
LREWPGTNRMRENTHDTMAAIFQHKALPPCGPAAVA